VVAPRSRDFFIRFAAGTDHHRVADRFKDAIFFAGMYSGIRVTWDFPLLNTD
jgi:hypothetical protein